MEILHAGQGRGTSLTPQTVSSKRFDEIDGLQCSDILPEGRAASVVIGTVRGAHHSRHGSPLHPGVATYLIHFSLEILSHFSRDFTYVYWSIPKYSPIRIFIFGRRYLPILKTSLRFF